ncbi:T-box transcription factor TBX22 isoform X1 [Pangasianodon hypophthalmus]|uniref:T-box transcription factor TBX22 isoform X1 n=1 Tax=Pangasianodon hypophthalmus TaxID=310915 RepID=UPI0023077F22|nr:T-box transcription factor TBX22 isoform X1 [Pangasianodon hypophthalmus]
MAMQSLSEAGERVSVAWPRAQGLSRRAHAFSVEALVGKSCKRMKVEKHKEEKIEASECDLDTSTGTVVDEAEDSEYQIEETLETTSKPAEDKSAPDAQIQVELQGSDLWSRFHEIGTEMIITKAGRRMFPSIRVKVRNLDPFKQYYIAMDIKLVDSKRYRYVYHSSQWMVAGNTDHSCISPRLYIHPDSPCSGETWMRQVISFDRVKLTNNEMDDKGHIILQSMHKYKPRVHVVVHEPSVDVSQISALPNEGVCTFSFPETQFTTVTAYQNQQITKLKIDRNPFAKGFRDPGRNRKLISHRGVLDGVLDSYPWRNPFGLNLKPFTLELQGENCGSSESCGDISPLKSLLPHPSSLLSHPFTLSGPESDHNLSVPLCSKVTSSNTSFTSQSYCSLIPDRLRGYSGLRPLMDYPMLSPLHGKKIGGCRGQCLHSHCLLSIQNLQASRTSGTHQDTATTSLISPYGLYSYSLPFRPHFSSITSTSKPADSIILASSESLLRQTAWHSTVNHCV